MRTYLNFLKEIYTTGCVKKDRTGVGTISKPGMHMRFNLKDGFPLLTTKKVHLHSVIHELLWFLSGETDVKYLKDNKVRIWDEWATAEQCARFGRKPGDLGPIYGHQWRNFGATKNPNGSYNSDGFDQIKKICSLLAFNPDSRRIILSGWNPKEADEVALPPCHTLFQLVTEPLSLRELKEQVNDIQGSVLQDYDADYDIHSAYMSFAKANGKPTRKLTGILHQRSADAFLGVPFNIVSYSLLIHMFCNVYNMVPGEFIWNGGDCHIYLNHLEQVKQQLSRTPSDLPKLHIAVNHTSIFDFEYDDFFIEGYNPQPAIKAPVAV